MFKYLIKRLLFVIPTLWAIITLNFFIVQIAPGGPVEQAIANLEFSQLSDLGTANLNQSSEPFSKPLTEQNNTYRGARGLDQEIIDEINKRFGFDKPLHQRYFEMLWRYIKFDFGDSFFKGSTVLELIKERLPVSISLGLWSTLLIYLISIPLGIKKAVTHGSRFDLASSWIVIVLYSIPGFLFAMLLIVIFAGGSYLNWFPLRGLSSINSGNFTWLERVIDYIKHITLPVIAMTIGGFATLTFLTKNSFIAEINKQYVVTARAKGLSEGAILYRHVFRNAMLIIIAGFPAAFISMFFTSSVLIEVIFSLNGIGLLGYEATLQRDYPVMFGTLYIFTLLGLILNIISDLTYAWVDPRIDFEAR